MTVLDVYLIPDTRDIARLLKLLAPRPEGMAFNAAMAFAWVIVFDGVAPAGFRMEDIISFAERRAILVETGERVR